MYNGKILCMVFVRDKCLVLNFNTEMNFNLCSKISEILTSWCTSRFSCLGQYEDGTCKATHQAK